MRNYLPNHLGMVFTSLGLFILLSGCNFRSFKNLSEDRPTQSSATPEVSITEVSTPSTPSLLTICMGQEPASLFLFGDSSFAARSIRQAIYDGPLDIHNYEASPVILESIPTLANGGVSFELVSVPPGGVLVDAAGIVSSLSEGISYLPSGCSDFSCAATYAGQDPAQIDQMVVRFQLRPGVSWEDGSPLKADDSQYAYEVARSLYPRARSDILERTQSYSALNDQTIEWRSIPGYRNSGYLATFFSPLPRHAWGSLPIQDLLTSETSTRKPLGWGPFKIVDWVSGDHISLIRNENYFRRSEGLPHFERLVFRFISSPDQAIAALLAGECDLLDETNVLEAQKDQLIEAQTAGKLTLLESASSSWETIVFGIDSLSSEYLPIFQTREVRQAVAMCIDRHKIAEQLFQDQASIPDSYVAPDHPQANPDVRRYSFDPSAAGQLLDAAGWKDDDANPSTPRRAQAVTGIPDGTPFEITFLSSDAPENQLVGENIRESVAQCGISISGKYMPPEQLFSTGQGAPIFGREFQLAQFGWKGAWQPPCFLFLSQEIPGPYPQHPKGWGGSNPGGYSSLDFDRACERALSTLPEDPGFSAAHFLAQAIFCEDIPAIPLYLHQKLAAIRPGLCGFNLETSSDSALWNLENFSFDKDCAP